MRKLCEILGEVETERTKEDKICARYCVKPSDRDVSEWENSSAGVDYSILSGKGVTV